MNSNIKVNNISQLNNLTSGQVKSALEEQFSRIFWQYLKGIVSEQFTTVDVEKLQPLQVFLLAEVTISTERANETNRHD